MDSHPIIRVRNKIEIIRRKIMAVFHDFGFVEFDEEPATCSGSFFLGS